MLHVFISTLISIRSNLSVRRFTTLHLTVLLLFVLSSIHSSCSASISTLSNLSSTSSDPSESMSKISYQNFILRQYFIDLLNISHASLVRSMSFDHHSTKIQSVSSECSASCFDFCYVCFYILAKLRRRKRLMTEVPRSSPLFTLQSTDCSISNHQIHATFIWSHPLASLTSIELIYHINASSSQPATIPVRLRWKPLNSSSELLNMETQLQFDAGRDFYFIDILPHFPRLVSQPFTIETIFEGETCSTSQIYMIASSSSPSQTQDDRTKSSSLLSPSFNLRQLVPNKIDTSPSSACKLRSVQIQFEELGLAYLIIRPKEYLFTYCAGACSSLLPFQSQSSSGSSMHAFLQMMAQKTNPHLPKPTCVPSEYADDHFLLRQNDGTIELSPIKDIIVKRCACL